MPCALASILLPESRAHGYHMQKTLFPGTYWVNLCKLQAKMRAEWLCSESGHDGGWWLRLVGGGQLPGC